MFSTIYQDGFQNGSGSEEITGGRSTMMHMQPRANNAAETVSSGGNRVMAL